MGAMTAESESNQPRVPHSVPGIPVQQPSSRPPTREEEEAGESRKMKVGMRIVGSVMVFIGFLQVFLSVSTGAEISIFPMIIYFAGIALWAYSSIEIIPVRYTVMLLSIICGLAFLHFGEVLFWHKYAIYWGTVALVVFFMFQTPKRPSSD